MTLAKPFTHDPRVYSEAKSLIKAGHKVTILAWDRKGKEPPIELRDGIKIIRSHNTNFMDLLPYDILKLHFWWNKGFKDALKIYNKNPFEVIHCHDLDTLQIGIKLKKKLGLPIIYDAHEIWGYMIARDIPKFWANYYLFLEKINIKNVDRIITVSEPLKDYFSKITKKPITLIMNSKEAKDIIYEKPKNDKFTLIYLGSLNKGRFLLDSIDVIKELPDVHYVIGGIGKPEYVNILKKKCSNFKNINFVGTIPMKKVLSMTKKSDAVICMFDPSYKINQVGLPNKLFEAMVCGRPIICTKGIYSGEFVEKEKCGLAVNYKKDDLRDAINKLRNNPKLCEDLGKKGLKTAIQKYNWEKQEEKLGKIYEDIRR